jgi:membrane-bound lytic murein transglycosylase D
MIARLRIVFIFIVVGIQLQAQPLPVIEVPDEIEFAGMQLKFTKEAKEILQKDITLLTKSSKYFQTKIDRANLYFPLIEKVFEEESFPKDFKYLPVQESSLICDAVSKSNAVGYWQFKKESAIEVGLRVDDKVDERMNIVSSSRGATRYLKRNNQTFDNWTYSLLSYNLGLGGAKSQIDQANIGVRKMTVDENMHWYVVRFLAHKLIYQNAVGNSSTVDTVLVVYINGANKTLQEIAQEYNLDVNSTISYNKWLKTDRIPDDKIYPVILAMPMAQAKAYIKTTQTVETDKKDNKSKKEKFPSISQIDLNTISSVAYTFVVNGVKVILARSGDNSVKLATKGDISKEEFLKYNEMRSFDDVIPGKIYYLDNKKNKAMVMFHTVQYNESLWDIAQNYGIKSETIREKNRMEANEALIPGRVLWLRTKRPKGKPIEYKAIEHPRPIVKEAPVSQTSVMDTTVIKKTEELKKTDNIFEHYNSSVGSFVLDSVNNNCTFHEVVTGETLFGISRKYQVPTDTLMRWNGMEGYGIKLGQILLVGYKSKVVEPATHTVVTGDTYYKIARQYNVSVAELQQWNNRTDMNLKLGEKLVIRKNQP